MFALDDSHYDPRPRDDIPRRDRGCKGFAEATLEHKRESGRKEKRKFPSFLSLP